MATHPKWPRLFVKLFGIGAALVLVVSLGVYEVRRKAELAALEDEKVSTLAAQSAFLLDVLGRLSADLTILSRQSELEDPDPEALERLAKEYGAFVRAVGDYQSVRLLDSHDTELVRAGTDEFGVIHTHVGAAPTPESDARAARALAAMSREAMLLVDRTDASGMHLRPLWRLAVATEDDGQGPRFVVADYRADILFDRLARLAGDTPGAILLIGGRGVWSAETGRALPGIWEHQDLGADPPNPLRANPDTWRRILGETSGVAPVRGGFVVFRKVFPALKGFWGLNDDGTATPERSEWQILALVSPEAVAEVENGILESLVPSTLAALLTLGLLSWIGALSWTGYRSRHARLVRQATTDALTGALNRAAFDEGFRAAVDRYAASGEGFALIYVDLDDFKGINDRFGHDAGDACLVETVRRIRAVIREGDLIGRLGGDEFAAVLAPLRGRAAAEAIRDKIRAALAIGPPPFPGAAGPIAASLGLALCPDDGTEAEMLLRAADLGMYGAKRRRDAPPS